MRVASTLQAKPAGETGVFLCCFYAQEQERLSGEMKKLQQLVGANKSLCYALKRTHRLKPVVFVSNKNGKDTLILA
mgnify:CR=1 FL=1